MNDWYYLGLAILVMILFSRLQALHNECSAMKSALRNLEYKLEKLTTGLDFSLDKLHEKTKDTNDFIKGSGVYDPRYRSDP